MEIRSLKLSSDMRSFMYEFTSLTNEQAHLELYYSLRQLRLISATSTRRIRSPEESTLTLGNIIQQTGQDIGRPLWKTAPNGETAPRSELRAVSTAQRRRWANEPDRYEHDPGIPQDLHQMHAREWQQHDEQAFNPDARDNYAQRYWQDPLVQGDGRPGGALHGTGNSEDALRDPGAP
ncbi:hypothetical protein HBI51_099060 [Parastagonospora nodorum]|nr:hypothetical protein HBI51_099060 [Parastagonospora nodorum]